MADATLTLTNVSTRSVGNRKQGTGTLNLVSASSDTYPTGGIAMPTGWKNEMGCPNAQDFVLITPEGLSTVATVAAGFYDSSADKFVMMGGDGTTAGINQLSQVKNAAVIPTGTYPMKIIVQGN